MHRRAWLVPLLFGFATLAAPRLAEA